jgi:ribonuclease HI
MQDICDTQGGKAVQLEDIKGAVVCFTDGNAPRKNTKAGTRMSGTVGWGFVKLLIQDGTIRKEKQACGKVESATVDMSELKAIIEAMKSYLPAVKRGTRLPLHIVCDRQNLVKGFNEWKEGWKKKGWRNSSGKKIANAELWKEADQIHLQLQKDVVVHFIHMKGHARGNEPEWMKSYNNIADQLAQKGREK